MIARFAAAAFALVLAVPSASARTAPNFPRPTTFVLDGMRAPMAEAAAPAVTNAVFNVPLPAGAEQVDSTYYDLQDFGSLGQRIVIEPDGKVHVTYIDDFCELNGSCPPNSNDPDPYPWRGMAYAYRSGGVWTRVGKVQDQSLTCCMSGDHVGGFGTIDLTPAGAAAIAQHGNEHICQRRASMYLQNGAGATTWNNYPPPLAPGVGADVLEFPQAIANPNGSFTLIAEDPVVQYYNEVEAFMVSYLPGTSTSYSCPQTWPFGAWTTITTPSMFRDGRPAFPSLARGDDGRVGVAVGDFGGNVYLIESSNGTFSPGTITTTNLTNYSDASIVKADSTSTQYRPYIHCHLAYNGNTPNVVWSELQARKVASTIQYWDWRSRVMHWDPVRGVEVVKQVAAGEADRYDDVDQGLNGPLPGISHIAVDWPQVGFSSDGSETYVVWLRFVDAEVDTSAHMNLPTIVTGVGYGDIACSATRAGDPWDAPVNLTETPQTDERFVSIARYNPDGKVHVVFQASATNQAGDAVFEDRALPTVGAVPNPPLLRRIAYLARSMGGTVGVADAPRLFATTMVAFPNPSDGGVRFALAGGAAAVGTHVDVFTVTGRHVARVPAGRDGAFQWDARGTGGARVTPGVYFARLADAPGSKPVRFMLIR